MQQVYCTGGTRRRRGCKPGSSWHDCLMMPQQQQQQRLSSVTSAQMLQALLLALSQFFSLASGGSSVSFVLSARKGESCARARMLTLLESEP